ncbi:MAG TPA: pyridoxamine 5'-phosphate oxidase family protein [Ktedonobacteraceae bacterium]|jgi:nitroimidazol reductase NimA-like FMN-containing flavoprotein (pyridoxamine 5'-phosphate oxidase superfamily)|nr:pyridoxamine 5'-phosphate oxidase family protein [Ktedonobacteraceae bacterium]
MLGKLEPAQIDEMLYNGSIGRIGCYAAGRTYIIPMNYAYDGDNIYGRSITGTKLDIMRINPEVCFQVDQVKNLSNWKSVIAWGTFQELEGEEAAKALHLLVQRLTMLIASGQSLHEMRITGALADDDDLEQKKITVYRIHLAEKTGRFEMTE